MVVNSRHAVFRCDASAAIGTGHVMRCLTLADELKTRGWTCKFWSDPESAIVVPALERSGHHILTALPPICDILVVDHYGLDAAFESSCRPAIQNIAVIDDLANRPHDCDLLMDQTYGRNTADYKSLVPAHCKILAGSNYALLRPQFATVREKSLQRRRRGGLQRVLVSAGGMNTNNITTHILEDIAHFKTAPLIIDVVLGHKAEHMNSVRGAINFIANETPHKVLLHTDVADMAKTMAFADLAIGSGGTTSWERCCVGLPSLIIEIADNQKIIARNLHRAGAAINFGWYEKIAPNTLSQAIADFIAKPENLVTMSMNAAKVCDGKGTQRMAEAIEYAVS